MNGWSLTLSFFGASLTLARQPECQTNQQTNTSEAGQSAPATNPAQTSRAASPSHASEKSELRRWASGHRSASRYRRPRRPSWRRLLKSGA
jgi:Ni/Co efflux regulator RcnB